MRGGENQGILNRWQFWKSKMSMKPMKQQFLISSQEEKRRGGDAINGSRPTAAISPSTTTKTPKTPKVFADASISPSAMPKTPKTPTSSSATPKTPRTPMSPSATPTVMDSETALKNFLDSIPISSIPHIKNRNFRVVELRVEDSLWFAIKMMLSKNLYGAPIADALSSSSEDAAVTAAVTRKAANRYIGFLSFPTMVLWCLEEMEKQGCFQAQGKDASYGFFDLMEQNPSIGKTKIRELAKSFLWDSFFPVNSEDDTLFRALLLFSEHRLHVLPVTDKTNTTITGFITQNALLELLLESRGLEWFDGVANSPLWKFRFNNEERTPHVYADQSVWEALRALRKGKAGVVAVIERKSKELVGNFRSFDIHHLLDDDEHFSRMRTMTVSEFMRLESARKGKTYADSGVARSPRGFMSAGDLRLSDNHLAKMASPVTHKMSDTLEQAMKTMVETRSETSFLIDSESHKVLRTLTSRNIIMEFAPPGVDTRLRGGGFFEMALEQSGCHFERGKLICDH